MIAAVLMLGLALKFIRSKNKQGEKYFALLMFFCSWYALCYVLEISTPSLELGKLFLCFEYFGAVVMAPLLLLFALKYTNYERKIHKKTLIYLFLLPLLFLIAVISNEWHHWFYTNFERRYNGYFLYLHTEKNFLFWVHQAYALTLSLVANLIILNFLLKVPAYFRKQVAVVAAGALSVWLIYIFQLTGLTPYHLDALPFGFLLLGFIINLGLSKLKLFKLQPLAYKNLFKNLSDGVIVVDSSRTIIECNYSAIQLLNINREQFVTEIAKFWPELVELLSPDCETHVKNVEREFNNQKYHYSIKRSINYSDDGEFQGMILIVSDITSYEQMKKDTERVLEFLRQTNDIARTGGWEVDLINDRIIWTDVTSMIHELPPGEVPNLQAAINFYKEGEHRELVRQTINQAIEHGTPMELESLLITATGKEKWVRTIGKAEFQDGQCVRLIGAIQDIHQQKLTEQALIEARNNAGKLLDITSEQNKRLSNFTYIVSHNIKSNIANIEGLLSIIDLDDKEDTAMQLQHIHRAVKGLEETIHNLNDIITIQNNVNLPQSSINILHKLKEIAKSVEHLLDESKVRLELCVPNNAKIETNLAYFESIFINFITNAIKYRNRERDAFVKISYKYENLSHLFVVEDNGLGMDLNKVGNKIFGMFKTFHGNPDAKGIGLFITKSQIEALKGIIEVESKPNVGTKFKVTFYANHR